MRDQNTARTMRRSVGPLSDEDLSHEWPGRIALGVGCFTSAWCVVGILLRWG